jgi:hypothetical protein
MMPFSRQSFRLSYPSCEGYSQVYIFRLLLGELPPKNHAILKDLALLLRYITLRNDANVTKKVIMSFGRLLMKERDNGAIVHRCTCVTCGLIVLLFSFSLWKYYS